jgi:small-conductance mechanosensitive channel
VTFLADHPALKEFLGSLLWLAAAYVAARIASFLIGLLIERSNERGVDQRLLSALKRPITYALFLFGAWAAVNRMPVSARVDAVVDGAIFAFGVLLVTLALARAYSILLDWYAARAQPDAASRDLAREFNPLFSKVGKVFIALVALSMLLQHFGVNVASLVCRWAWARWPWAWPPRTRSRTCSRVSRSSSTVPSAWATASSSRRARWATCSPSACAPRS